MTMFGQVSPTRQERAVAREGDSLVRPADVVMDRAFTVPGTPAQVWPWVQQLGKGRAGWYLPRRLEQVLPARGRAIRDIDPRWQHLAVGDVIPDYGGRQATFEVAALSPDEFLVYTSERGRIRLSWSITLTALVGAGQDQLTRVHLRLRLGHVRRKWLARSAGELLDVVTIAGMATGLRERLEATP
jgi:hypothetical protein